MKSARPHAKASHLREQALLAGAEAQAAEQARAGADALARGAATVITQSRLATLHDERAAAQAAAAAESSKASQVRDGPCGGEAALPAFAAEDAHT